MGYFLVVTTTDHNIIQKGMKKDLVDRFGMGFENFQRLFLINVPDINIAV
jgi:hypothetical protein